MQPASVRLPDVNIDEVIALQKPCGSEDQLGLGPVDGEEVEETGDAALENAYYTAKCTLSILPCFLLPNLYVISEKGG